jgi:Flp pilus assembly protein TadD
MLSFTLLLLAGALAAQEEPALSTNSLTGRASAKFAAGDREGACQDAMRAALENPSDDKALGIAKLTCGKARTNLKFQGLKIQRHEIAPEKESSPSRQEQAVGPKEPGAVVIPAVPTGSVAVEVTSYGKTVEAQDAAHRGRYAEAAAAASAAVSLEPRNMRAHVLLAETHRALGEPRKSLEAAEAGLKVNPENLSLLKNKAAAQIELGDFKAAVEASELALKANSTDPLAHALRAFALGRLGDRVGMISALRTASALDPAYERLFIEAQNSEEGAQTPFVLPGQARAKAVGPAARRKTPEDRLKKKLLFLGLLLVLVVIGALLVQSLVAYWTRQVATEDK